MYEKGQGIKQDYSKAMSWYKKVQRMMMMFQHRELLKVCRQLLIFMLMV
ncbi:SEL1-like repeat protein [Oenococcus oeni]|nr:SEL1-like repeat protein [Oenococcus oeni]